MSCQAQQVVIGVSFHSTSEAKNKMCKNSQACNITNHRPAHWQRNKKAIVERAGGMQYQIISVGADTNNIHGLEASSSERGDTDNSVDNPELSGPLET